MENHSTNALLVRGCSKEGGNKYTVGRSKSRGGSKYPGNSLKNLYWKCGKVWHFKKDCRSKSVERGKGLDETPPIERKFSSKEGGDVYLASTSTKSKKDIWLIDSGDSFHMTPHRDWFCEYEKYNGGDVLLRDDSTTKIVECETVKFLLNDGRNRTLPHVLHILDLSRNLIYEQDE